MSSRSTRGVLCPRRLAQSTNGPQLLLDRLHLRGDRRLLGALRKAEREEELTAFAARNHAGERAAGRLDRGEDVDSAEVAGDPQADRELGVPVVDDPPVAVGTHGPGE